MDPELIDRKTESGIRRIVKNNLLPKENFIFGFAGLRGLLNESFSEFEYGISIGRKLDDDIINGLKEGPTLEYHNHYTEINNELWNIARRLKTELSDAGVKTYPVEPTVFEEDMGEEYEINLSTEVSHKLVATRAGLGWIGKTDLLITKKFGPRVRLVSLLINKNPGLISVPVENSRCGKCSLCVNFCPGAAANGALWNTRVKREDFYDAQKCRKTCHELAVDKLKINERICGMCVYICPIGRKKKR